MNPNLATSPAPVPTDLWTFFERSSAPLPTTIAIHSHPVMKAGAGRVPAVSTDGRVARRQRNRERVVDAYVQLLREGKAKPTAEALAEVADVTPRTVYRYMSADSTLKTDVADRIVSTLRHPFSLDESVPATLHDRIAMFVAHRLDAYEHAAPIMRVVRNHLTNEPVAMVAVEAALAALDEKVAIWFAPELGRLERADQRELTASLQTLVLFDSLEFLFYRVSPDRSVIHDVLCRNLHAVVSVASSTS